jgi:hypothetical protein
MEIHGEGLLGENALDVVSLYRFLYYSKLLVRRICNVKNFHPIVVEQLLPGVVHARNSSCLGRFPCMSRCSRSDCNRFEARVIVCDELYVPHDESRPDASYAEVPFFGITGSMFMSRSIFERAIFQPSFVI